MNDIDYDELDRAVNSLTNKANPEPSSSPAVTVNVGTQNISPAPAPQAAAPATVVPAPAPVTVPKPPTGRFMDVMHPSSDMRSSQPVIPQRPASPAPAASSANVETYGSSDLVEQSISPDKSQSTNSPFLPGAKVDKRPLGAFADSNASLVNEGQTTDKPSNEAPLPPELGDELLSVETSEEAPVEEPAAATFAVPAASSTPTAPVNGSILQQYVEKAEPAATPTSSIFEVGSIKPASKKSGSKSGWLVVLWIFLLIIVGAGIGAVVYFYVLP